MELKELCEKTLELFGAKNLDQTSKKFKTANSKIKQATLEKYFDADTLPTRYLETYCGVEKMW